MTSVQENYTVIVYGCDGHGESIVALSILTIPRFEPGMTVEHIMTLIWRGSGIWRMPTSWRPVASTPSILDLGDNSSAAPGSSASPADGEIGGFAEGNQLSGIENITGSNQADLLVGNAAGNVLDGGASDDVLRGEGGDDTLLGGEGNDTLDSGEGNDTLTGGDGNDTMTGGSGNDSFQFDTALNTTTNVDQITDFIVVDDTIRLDNSVFTALSSTGVLSADNFAIGAAPDADDFIIYDDTNGGLFYDNDGSGIGDEAIQFATLNSGLAITHDDFLVV